MYKRLSISKTLLLFSSLIAIWAVYMSHIFLHPSINGQVLTGLGVFIVFYISSGLLLKAARRIMRGINHFLDNTSIEVLMGGTLGLLVGILVGVLSSFPLSMIRGLGVYLTITVFLVCGYLGLMVGSRRAGEVLGMLPARFGDHLSKNENPYYKIIDTSAIIDGRIYDVCLSNFLDGQLIVPTIVVEELQHIADSSDNVRRNKGRRGLELLSKMQKHPEIKIDIMEVERTDDRNVDGQLIALCKKLNASIITNDYNLNKVAELQGIKVLNINELTNAVKVIVYPGETMRISIIKEGKEPGQGVGYLEDGTMVVVECADNEIGHELEVMVTSVFQTAAGRMIFTRKVKEESSTGHHSFPNISEVNLYG
jgi:uncharacterized protein YacL